MHRPHIVVVGTLALVLAALTVALLVRGDTFAGRPPDASTTPAATASRTAATSAAGSPVATAEATASPSATATAATADPSLAAYIVTHTRGWRPAAGTTLFVSEFRWTGSGPTETTYLAVPIDAGGPTRLLTVRGLASAAILPDGSAIALTVRTAEQPPTSRLAVWEASDGSARWLTPDEPGAGAGNPTWSPDGAFVYFGRSRAPVWSGFGEDLGVWRVRADGSGLERVVEGRPADELPPSVTIPHRVTPEGILLWGRAYEGSSLEVLDLTTGERRSYGFGHLDAWRSTRPRALVEVCSNTGCRGLVLWDDIGDTKRVVLDEDVIVQGADWEPGEPPDARIVVSRRTGDQWRLQSINEATLAAIDVAGSENASWPVWTRSGIAFTYGTLGGTLTGLNPPTEVRVPTGDAPRTLYRVGAADLAVHIVDVIER